MRRFPRIPLLPALFVGWLVVLAVFGSFILGSQRDSRSDFEDRFQNRVETAVGQLEAFRAQMLQRQRSSAERWLGGAAVGERRFGDAVAVSGHAAAVLLDDRGRALRVAPANPAVLGKPIAREYPHLSAAVAGRAAVSPVVKSAARAEDIVAFAVPFDTPAGRRVFSSGYRVAETPLAGYVRHAVALERGEAFLVDDRGTVMLTNAAGDAGRSLPAAVTARSEGSFDAPDGRRHFAQMAVPGTPWRVVLTVPESVLYAPVSGLAWLPWAVLIALGIAGLVALRLVARRAAAERELAASEALHRHTVRHLPDAAVLVFDRDLRYTLAEGPALSVLGWEPAGLVGRTLPDVVPAERLAEMERHYRAALAGNTVPLDWDSVRGDRRLEGTITPLRDDQDRVIGGLLVARDVTVRRKMEQQLRRLAETDPLTGLWNRRRFEDALVTQAARCRRHDERAALLVLDLDHFKDVNDRHGHHVGDRLISHVAEVLGARVRTSDAVARLGGDEFAVLLAHVTPDEAAHTAESISRALRDRPLVLEDGTLLLVTTSIGIAFLDTRSADASQAMVNADIAMYDAKAAGRNKVSGLRQADGAEAGTVRVFHCDDSEPYRRLLGEMLRAHGDIDVVGEAGDGGTSVSRAAAARPDVILFDASLETDDPETVAQLREALPAARVLVLSGSDHCPDSLEDLVDGFLPKSSTFDEIAAAVRG